MSTSASNSIQRLTSSPTTSTPTHKLASDSDSQAGQVLTPDRTPSETPPHPSKPSKIVRLDLNGDSGTKMDPPKDEHSAEAVDDTKAEGSSATKSDPTAPKPKDSGAKLKARCKKHSKKKAKLPPKVNDNSSSSSDSSESSSSDDDEDDDETESDSASESESEDKKKSRKTKARKAAREKVRARRRKTKSKKPQESSDESASESSSGISEASSEASEEEPTRRRRKPKSRKRSRRSREPELSDSEDAEMDDDEDVSNLAKLEALDLLNRARRLGKSKKRSGSGRGDKQSKDKTSKSKKSKESKKKGKRASKLEFKRVDQRKVFNPNGKIVADQLVVWDDSIHNYKLTDTAPDEDADEYDQYVFTVRRKFDWEGKYTDTVIDIKSKLLKDALNDIMDGVKGISLVEETPVVDPNMLFLYLEELRACSKDLRTKEKAEKKRKKRKIISLKRSHVKLLVKYLDKDYAETKKTLYPLLESKLITFDLLWAIFKPNTIAYTSTYGNSDEPRAFKIEYSNKESSFMKGEWYSIEGRYLEYDGKSFGMGQMEVEVEKFKGARKITGLACYPLKYHKDQEALKEKLLERGKKFVALRGMNYRFHKGMAFYKKKRVVVKVNINGRIMVDPAIYRRINPNYPISTVKPKDPDIWSDSDDEEDDECCECQHSDSDDEGQNNGDQSNDEDKEATKWKLVLDDKKKTHIVKVPVDENGEEIVQEKLDKLAVNDSGDEGEGEEKKAIPFTDEELIIASPVVLGFAFNEKLWLEFTVSGVHDIIWNEGAFSSLVLPENQKSIVKALVESHTFHAAQNIDDVIQGKGKGLVAVLHGPPGTGKTLTAEGIAELLKCPLYMVSAGELGTDPRTLEGELNKILDIAHSWGAVLLLDEADVFLEKRTIQDIHRNALVSIFLRLLEYFQGILFLTTNRVETFDDAFQSRIHIALRYGELTTKAKKTVWKLFLARVNAMEGVQTIEFKEDDYDTLARNNLNGRQIKNCVRTAQALAVNKQEQLSMEHIKRVLQVAESFDHDLRGGTGYMDAMRSYT
ncbi:MAG: hypothetical protein M1819_007464 [Sarea resinae]|nr:MAG: hypothetical protein M1819_007464 [Sarea resinae]